MKHVLLLMLVIGGTLQSLERVAGQQSKAANIVLKAKWQSTSSLLEAAEFLGEEAADLLWQYADAWHGAERSTEEDCWEQVVGTAGSLLSTTMTKVLQVSLGIRQYSPRLEVFRKLAAVHEVPQGTCAFVELNGSIVTSSENLDRVLQNLPPSPTSTVKLQEFEHVFLGMTNTDSPVTTAFLYGAIGTPAFWELHRKLSAAVRTGKGRLRYVYRPVLLEGCFSDNEGGRMCWAYGASGKLQLPGFGVEMAIKNMEYSAMDDKKVAAEREAAKQSGGEASGAAKVAGFDFQKLVERKLELKQELLTFKDHLLAFSSAEETLKVWDLKDLGLQATQRIVLASDPLQGLSDISQNFPNLAASLSRVDVTDDIRGEILRNSEILPAGATYVLLNGLTVDPSTDIYDLLDRIRKEVRLAEQLSSSGLQPIDVSALLSLRAQWEAPDSSNTRIDLITTNKVTFVNNLEKDSRYKRWGWSVMDLLRPMFPGTLPRIARNLFTVVAIIDPGTPEGLRIAHYARGVVAGGQIPVRFGLLLAPEPMLERIKSSDLQAASATGWDDISLGEKIAALFAVISAEESPLTALDFLAAIAESLLSTPAVAETEITWILVEAAFTKTAKKFEELEASAEEAHTLLEGGVAALLASQTAFVSARGLGSQINSMWLNGAPLPEGLPSLQAQLSYGIQFEMQRLQEMAYFGKISDDEADIPRFLLDHFHASPRFNPRLTDASVVGPAASQQLPLTGALSPFLPPISELGYLHHGSTEDDLKAVTHWIAADLGTKEGKMLAMEALRHLQDPSSGAARMAFLHCPAGGPADSAGSQLARVALAASQLLSRRAKIPAFLTTLLDYAGDSLLLDAALDLAAEAGLNRKALKPLLDDTVALNQELDAHYSICRDALKLPANSAAVITNGRVVLAHSPSANITDTLVAEDFLLLVTYAATAQLATQVAAVLEGALSSGRSVVQAEPQIAEGAEEFDLIEEATVQQVSDVALLASSVLATHLSSESQAGGQAGALGKAMEELGSKHSMISVGGATPGLDFTAVLDPLTKTAQSFSAVLDFFRATLQPSIKVHLNPKLGLSTLPLSSFYRFALPVFDAPRDGHLGAPQPPSAFFSALPSSKVLTLHMDVPEAWLVEPVRAAYDLDNLRLSDLGDSSTLNAEFELEALLLTGSCTDSAARSREQVTPRGVQLQLGTPEQPLMVDTLVMSNLGYYQLKAAPGVYNLRLAPGRSQELYTVEQDGAKEGAEEVQMPVVMDSLRGKVQRLKLRKRPGFETADVLDEVDGNEGSLLGKFSSWLGSSEGKAAVDTKKLSPEEDPDTVHLFTIASGHMYERLQKIMILSVLRNTESRVKVWFIKNYMSPQMKRFLPHMAEHYGFDYEFVTYKWPSWLHKQTDKQRIIWAYKILFLDVIFPLNLRRVIFVDSDQIIRADFAELMKMDLKGAPLAYTPFCDNNKDMDGFRFWKQGFWQDHLHGKPYHISALYVVDLAKFRQMAAGDQLRIVYEQLSRDPNSLSNLDQDLPNYAQHSVPIFSLPQEWLWCETWCGNSTKAAAKTIDLCNNPLTKEPKLQGARRIVAEWPALDTEAQAFTAEVEEQLSSRARLEGEAFEAGELLLSSAAQEELLTEAKEDGVGEQVGEGDSDRGLREGRESSHHDNTEL